MIAALGLVNRSLAANGSWSVTSPDGHVEFRLFEREKTLNYEVKFRGEPIIEPSRLQFTIDGAELTADVLPGKMTRSEVNDTYPWRGGHSLAINRADTAVIPFQNSRAGLGFMLEVRAANDGVAFRYVVPLDNHPRVPDENDSFELPAGSVVWYHNENGHYEGVHQKKKLAEIPPAEWAMPPVTFQLPRGRGYAVITEAALENFSGMALQTDGRGGFILGLAHRQPVSHPFELRYSTNDIARLSKAAAVSGNIVSPWRVVMIGRDLNALVNCDLIHNLCPPPDPELFPQGLHTPWLKPGRAVWKYMDGGESTVEGAKEFCRLAGQLGFEYNVIEGYWSKWSDDEIKDLVRYAREQGVGLWFWKHSRSLRTPEARDEFFGKLQDLGVVGAKIDFFDHEHKEVIDLYHALLADAAKHRVMVNFHGSNKPTGEARTWPNELTREAIRGMESSRLQDRATHDTTLPFTRYLAGHGDYTVLHFGARRANTTWAHQIATAAVFDMPLLTIVANPANILTNPAVDMIKSIPPDWDETIVLPPSEIGELAVFARRHGDQWFLAALNGTNARTIRVPLSFLPKGNLSASLVSDRPDDPASVKVETAEVKRSETLAIHLSSGGGFIARFNQKSAM